MANRMFPRVLVSIAGAVDAQGHLAVPQTVSATRLWDIRFPIDVAGLPGWEYRTTDDQLFIVIKVAAISTRVLAVLFVPAPLGADDTTDLRGLRTALATVVAKSWTVNQTRDLLDALEADVTALAVAVKNACPTNWRVRLSTDAVQSIDGTGSTAPPTGPRLIGALLG